MLDLDTLLETAQKTLLELQENNDWAYSFHGIETSSRYTHFIQLLTDLNKSDKNKENYLFAFKHYFEQTHNTTSFITAHPESDLSLNFFKIVIDAGKAFHLSPFAFIFPNLSTINNGDYLEDLSNFEMFQEHIKENNLTDEQLPNHLSSIVQRYLCGEKTLIDKQTVCEDYIFDENRDQRGTFRELPQGSEDYCPIPLSKDYIVRIKRAINNDDLDNYIRMTAPHYDPTFKGQLQYLADQLFENGVQGKYGSEDFAGSGATTAISEFIHYVLPKYQERYQKNATSLEEKIFLSFLMTEDKKGLCDESCIDIKSGKINSFIKNHELFLNGLEGTELQNNSTDSKDKLRDSAQSLKEKLQTQNACTLFIDKALPLDLHGLYHFTHLPLELYTLLVNANYISEEALEKYCKGGRLIGYTSRLSEEELFDAIQLHPFHLNFALEHMTPPENYTEIHNRLNNDEIFHFIKNQLTDAQLDEARKKNYISLAIKIKKSALAKEISKYPQLYNVLKEALPSINVMFHDLIRMLKRLNLDQCVEACNIMKERLPFIIETDNDLIDAAYILSTEQFGIVFDIIKEALPSLIKSTDSFESLLSILNIDKREEACNIMKATLPFIIETAYELKTVLYRLTPEQCTIVCNALKETLPSLIKSTTELKKEASWLGRDKIMVIYNTMTETLPSLIKTSDDLKILLKFLEAEECIKLCNLRKATVLSVIKTSEDLVDLFGDLDKKQIKGIFKAMKETLPPLIKTGDDLTRVLRTLEAEECIELCNIVKASVPSFIKTSKDLVDLIEPLNNKRREAVFNIIKEILPSLVKTSDDFQNMIYVVSDEQGMEVCHIMKETLPFIIKTGKELKNVFSNLNVEMCEEVCKTMENFFPALIKNCNELKNVFNSLGYTDREVVYNAMKETLPSLIQTPSDVGKVFFAFKATKYEAMCNDMKEVLCSIIKTSDDLRDVLNWINPIKHEALCNALKKRLPPLEVIGSITTTGDDTAGHNSLFRFFVPISNDPEGKISQITYNK